MTNAKQWNELEALRGLKSRLYGIYGSMVYAAPEMMREWLERMGEEFVDYKAAEDEAAKRQAVQPLLDEIARVMTEEGLDREKRGAVPSVFIEQMWAERIASWFNGGKENRK